MKAKAYRGGKNKGWRSGIFLITLMTGLVFASYLYGEDEGVKAGPQVKTAARADYASLVEKMTQKKKLYSIQSFDTLLDVRALYKSWTVRSAFVEEYSVLSLLSEQQKAKLQTEEEQAAKEGEEFLIAIYTTDEEWADLSKKDPVWRLYLYDDHNNRLEPKSIHKTSVSSATIWKFYPQISPWTKVYKVTFPKNLPPSSSPLVGPDTKKIKLIFAGILGRAELEWELK